LRPRQISILIYAVSVLILYGCGDPDVAVAIPPGPSDASILAMSCTGCHSNGSSDAIPSIEGYSVEALKSSLMTYKSVQDGDTVMHRLMRGYDNQDIEVLAEYLGDKNE